MRLSCALAFVLILLPGTALGATRSSYSWDPVRPVDPETLFFGEKAKGEEAEATGQAPSPERPSPLDKGYPWYCLEKGNEQFLNREYENAVVYFKTAYAVPGPTRVMSGFRLIDAYQKLDWFDLALRTLDDMEKKYLVSSREFREAARLRTELLDRKRRGVVPRKPEPFTGREWLKQVAERRLHYVLGAMDELHRHGIPLNEEALGYVFLIDEYFVANPETPAGDAVKVLADFVYERDPDARVPIDRWRADPESTVTREAKVEDARAVKFTGAEWVTMLHEDKLDYVSQAMEVLKAQRVPMEKTLLAYAEALDAFFTEQPLLSASDSVRAMASLLYDTEPEARKVLEALRLE